MAESTHHQTPPLRLDCRRRRLHWTSTISGIVAVIAALNGAVSHASLDRSRYIGLDEIRPDMTGFCRTVYRGQTVEEFGLRVLSLVPNWQPGRDAILVIGTDERFIHTGIVAGCSGSPVYLDGRMAGALAAGWYGSKDPLYLVTPIEYMLGIGTGGGSPAVAGGACGPGGGIGPAVVLDYTRPIDLAATDTAFRRQVMRYFRGQTARMGSGWAGGIGGAPVGMPIFTSLSSAAIEVAGEYFEAMGLAPVAVGQSSGSTVGGPTGLGGAQTGDVAVFEPGGVLVIPLVSGDISASVTGTVTEVVGEKVYGFGHSFGGTGAVDLPMAAGTIHTVVPGLLRAFKFSSPGPIVGAVRYDEAMGVLGVRGARPKLIDLVIRVVRYNDPQQRVYRCKAAVDRLRTPLLFQSVVLGAVSMYGQLPPEHTLRYRGRLTVNGLPTLRFDNISSEKNFAELATDLAGVVEKLLLNPFGRVEIQSLEVDVEVIDRTIQASIKSVRLSDTVVKAGQAVQIDVLLQSYLAEKTPVTLTLEVPRDLKPGTYPVQIMGVAEYTRFLSTAAPHRLTGYDLPTLARALQNLLELRRDRLYAVLKLPAAGLTVQQNELPDLPATAGLVLQDASRLEPYTRPMQHWVEVKAAPGKIVTGQQVVKITVEQP